jgi:galactose mutarotase-like enzyme
MTAPALTRVALRDAHLEASFVPDAGMLCCSLRHRGEELLAQNSGVAGYAERGKTMGIPLLYPWANRLAGFEYSVNGHAVTVPHDPGRVALDPNGLPIHGVIGGRLAFELTRTPTEDVQSLSAQLRWDESAPGCFEVFPFRHDVEYEAGLVDGCLVLKLMVHACGADAVPLAFGFHPYISLPGVAREHWLIELPAMRRLALDRNQIPTGPEQILAAERFELDAREFDDGFDELSEPARFAAAAGGRQVQLEFLEGYPCAQVFAPRSGQFICFEPMTAPANALRSGVDLRVVAPGKSYSATFALRVQDLSAAP